MSKLMTTIHEMIAPCTHIIDTSIILFTACTLVLMCAAIISNSVRQ